MVLIRIAHVAVLPTPGDLVATGVRGGARRAARLGTARDRRAAGGARWRRRGDGRGSAGHGLRPWRPQPRLARVVALTSGPRPRKNCMASRYFAHPVRDCAGRIEFRPGEGARATLARLAAYLSSPRPATRWTILARELGGERRWTEQGRSADAERRLVAQSHPLVQAVLAAFPGAKIEEVRDASLDGYGLPPPDAPADEREFAPPDAEPAGFEDDYEET
jgi:DNA polymerase-3 subunit gamma/tau